MWMVLGQIIREPPGTANRTAITIVIAQHEVDRTPDRFGHPYEVIAKGVFLANITTDQ